WSPPSGQPEHSSNTTTTTTSSALLLSSSPQFLFSQSSVFSIDNPSETNNYRSQTTHTTNSSFHEQQNTFPSKPALIPTNSHPLSHELSTSPMTPTFFNNKNINHISDKENESNIRQRRAYASLDSDQDPLKLAAASSSSLLRNRRSLLDISLTDGLNEDIQRKRSVKAGSAAAVAKECRPKRELERKTVIVHEVKKTDTLAGIALFYGIEVSLLKKTNKLWTNDSIHMHKYLYIPLDECKFDDDNERRTTVILEDDRIHISKNNNNNYHSSSSTSDSSRPSMSSPSSSPSNSPFTYYDREILMPHQTHEFCHDRKLSNVSTATIWSTSSVATTNLGFTSAEIQELSSAQLSYFPPHRTNNGTTLAKNPITTLDTSISSTITQPSPVPISHYQKNRRRNNNINLLTMPFSSTHSSNNSFMENPSKIVDKLITTLDAAGEKYWGRGFSSVKLATSNRRTRSDGDNGLGGIWSSNHGGYRGDSTELRSSLRKSSTSRKVLFANSFEDG
ncbi:4478_t:CDS:2, partial [Ambispora gerdemannii]